jgi:hypothetical protein
MKIERIVQLLFYLLLITIVLGLMRYNGEPVIAPNIIFILFSIILASIIRFLLYYYIPKKRIVFYSGRRSEQDIEKDYK